MRVLVIGAHPDDIELGCAGTIALMQQQNYEHFFLVLSNGEMSGNPEERIKEMQKSAQLLQTHDLFLGNLPDTQITEGIETISVIEKIIKKVNPEVVITHSSKERHQDHRNAALATYTAARRVPIVLSYESPSNILHFMPQYFICISNTIEKKIEALNFYKTQFGKNYLDPETIKGQARFRGFQANVKFAEAYEVIKIFKNSGGLF